MRTVLVMGFGPFGDVTDNPSERLARALDGRISGDVRIVGRSMPVSYERSITTTLAAIAEVDPVAVLGVGVAVDRALPQVEGRGRCSLSERADVDGGCTADLGTERRPSTWNPHLVAAALGCSVSDDAGSYVCNAWLQRMVVVTDRPTTFLHIPRSGVVEDEVLTALATAAPRTMPSSETHT